MKISRFLDLYVGLGIISLIVFVIIKINFASNTINLSIPELERLRFREKVLEIEKIELQLRPVMERRDNMIKEINNMIEQLYSEKKLDKLEYGLNIESVTFYKRTEEEKKQIQESQKK